ncbi:hypothetical protein MYX84_12435 [Acidobacteria bacterium AH-259-O06]|nr:hypothetical protein [Acidobacteria bacterium AH-259-O06]
MESALEKIKVIWKKALKSYEQQTLEERLRDRWADDRNVFERISYEYPPTFQPGYVGPAYFESGKRILMLGQNPGEGSSPIHQSWNVGYTQQLADFANDQTSFEELNALIASEMMRWRIFRGKGIFRENGDERVALVPERIRPSIRSVAYVNAFPFKTINNSRPFRTAFFRRIWSSFVFEVITYLKPHVIIRFPDCDDRAQDLISLEFNPTVVRVWHPSDYNLNTRREQLMKSWNPIRSCLEGTGENDAPAEKQEHRQTFGKRETPVAVELRSQREAGKTPRSGQHVSGPKASQEGRKKVGSLESFKDQLKVKLVASLDFPVSVEVGGSDWVVNISPAGVRLPPRVRKLIGVKPLEESTRISVARAAFGECGLSAADDFFGTTFSEEGSYMMLRIPRPLYPTDIASVIGMWLKEYVRNAGL